MTTFVQEAPAVTTTPGTGPRGGEPPPDEPLTPPAWLLAGEQEEGFEPHILRGTD